jgi:iron complex outermembrane receptor protein
MSNVRFNALSVAIAFALSPLLADGATEDVAAKPTQASGLDEILVTAQKREESIQDVPISISAIGESEIHRNLDNSPGDIARVVPNLYGNPTGGRAARPRWFLRGVGVNTSSLVSPVGVYADEVYQSSLELHSLPLFDIERVEVLRGPQGTLWGKNTPGGAIHFVSRKPTFDNDGYVKLGFGNLNQKELHAAFGGALVDSLLAGRIAYVQEERDGWARNLYNGDEKAGAYDDQAIRAQLLFTPTADFDALLNVHYRNVDSWAVPGYSIGIRAGGADDFGYVSPAGPNPRIGDPVNRNVDVHGEQEQYGATLTTRWNIGDYSLTSITAY